MLFSINSYSNIAALDEAHSYDAWGVLLEGRYATSVGADNTHEGYTGKVRDTEITAMGGSNPYAGLDYFGARTYAPAFARFLQVDPLMEKHPDFSPYNYVLNNPLALVDPDGRQQVATTGPSLPLANVMLPRIEPFWTSTRRTNEQAAIQRLRDEGQGFRATLRQGLNYLSRAGDAIGQGFNSFNRSGGLIDIPGPAAIMGPAKLGASVLANLADDAARVATRADDALQPSQRMIDTFRRQAQRDGERSLHRARGTIERRLQEHRQMLDQYTRQGGYTSSVETEIRTFERQLRAVEDVLNSLQ